MYAIQVCRQDTIGVALHLVYVAILCSLGGLLELAASFPRFRFTFMRIEHTSVRLLVPRNENMQINEQKNKMVCISVQAGQANGRCLVNFYKRCNHIRAHIYVTPDLSRSRATVLDGLEKQIHTHSIYKQI